MRFWILAVLLLGVSLQAAVVVVPDDTFLEDMTVTTSLADKKSTVVVFKNYKYQSSGGQGPFSITLTFDQNPRHVMFEQFYPDLNQRFKNKKREWTPSSSGYFDEIQSMANDVTHALPYAAESDKAELEQAIVLLKAEFASK